MRLLPLFFFLIFFSGCDSFQNHPVKENKNKDFFQEQLEKELSFARGQSEPGIWPRELVLEHTTRKWATGKSILEKRKVLFLRKPQRIVAHSVGIAEILWAIVPREKILGFHEACCYPENSLLSEEFQKRGNFFSGSETEKVISWMPDIVFTVSYSDYAFSKALMNAGIQTLDLGYVGDMPGLKKQILFLGECLGEEGNARVLVQKIEKYTSEFSHKFSFLKNIRIMDYSSFYTVSGKDSTFQVLCDVLGLINVSKEAGIEGFKTVEAEWILRQNPQAIVFCSHAVKEKLEHNPLLRELNAVQKGHLVYLDSKYLSSISQYMVAAANQIAEKLYAIQTKNP